MKVHTYCTCFNSSSSYTHPKISALPHVPPHVMQHTNESRTNTCEAASTALYLACQSVKQSINQLRWLQISNAGGQHTSYKLQFWKFHIPCPPPLGIFLLPPPVKIYRTTMSCITPYSHPATHLSLKHPRSLKEGQWVVRLLSSNEVVQDPKEAVPQRARLSTLLCSVLYSKGETWLSSDVPVINTLYWECMQQESWMNAERTAKLKRWNTEN